MCLLYDGKEKSVKKIVQKQDSKKVLLFLADNVIINKKG